ncbi:hypothetical protein, partial [Acinetobacter nosocomialis]|uniref:hypothetical protein n=1 Tax=Acinetobacter nosocomialis TaxID=106654 RepID=UPI001D18426D
MPVVGGASGASAPPAKWDLVRLETRTRTEGTLAPEEPGLRGRLATARSLVDGRTLYCAAENAP